MARVSPQHVRLDGCADLIAFRVGCPTEFEPLHPDYLAGAPGALVRQGDGPDFTGRSTLRPTPIHGLGP